MFCALCDQFIWAEGGSINDKRVCQSCLKALAEQVGILAAKDGTIADSIVESVWDEVYEAVEQAASEAATDAIDKVRRRMRTVVKVPA